MSEVVFTDVRFHTLDLEPALMRGVEDVGFDRCTPIQAQSLPLALAGTDVEGQAQTGTGKTAAFLLATMNLLLRKERGNRGRLNDPRALILAPTRELAVQIQKDAEVLGRHTGLISGVVFGGTGYESQRKMLEDGVDILIGTPGRTIDYLKQRIYGLDAIDVVVIDEADRMFDLGFIKDVRYVLRRMPPPHQRLNMLFSATLSHRVSELAYEHMNEPTLVDATPENVTVRTIRQALYHVSSEEKIPLLLGLLAHRDVSRTIVFTNTKRAAERVTDFLEGNGYDAGLLTGDVPQTKRLSLLGRFTEGKLAILVATDVAARGLHIPNVSHVFNYDLPQDAEDYVHRTGRTARAGASGDAVSFACEQFVFSLSDIEEFIDQRIPVEPVTDDLLVRPKPPVRRNRTRASGPRGRGEGKGGERPRRRRGGGRPGDGGGSSAKRSKQPVGDIS